MAFTEDLTDFLVTSDWAVTATFDGSTTVTGIFDDEFAEVLGDAIETSQPTFTCRTADVSDPVGKTLLVNGTTYDITAKQPDGTGMTTLVLREQ